MRNTGCGRATGTNKEIGSKQEMMDVIDDDEVRFLGGGGSRAKTRASQPEMMA